ncbi:hypothetical protein LguiB_014605 [Lonicera macranthoides]
MATLPIEIFSHHIFLKLSVKSLLRFKCVCRAWNHILRDPKFARMHLNHAIQYQSHKLLLNTPSVKGVFYSVDHQAIASNGGVAADAAKLLYFPLEVHQHVLEILGSFNGLVCVAVKHAERRYVNRDTKIVLWNPSTKDSKLLPDPNPSVDDSHILGFSYDSAVDDYNIVRIINCSFPFSYKNESQVDMYSLKTDSWKVIPDGPCNLPKIFKLWRGCALDGSIYWLAHNSPEVEANVIVVFDLKDAEFRLLPVPLGLEQEIFTYLKVLGGSLSIFQFRSSDEFVMWTMKEEWVKIMTIDCSSLHCAVVPILMEPICFLKNGKLLLKCFFEKIDSSKTPSDLVLYDSKTNNIEDFHIQGIGKGQRLDSPTFSLPGITRFLEERTYIETLVSPNFSDQG